MKLDLNFTKKEKIDFLKERGYKVSLKSHLMRDPVGYKSINVYQVYIDRKPFMKPKESWFGEEDWLNLAFEDVITGILKNVLLTLKCH